MFGFLSSSSTLFPHIQQGGHGNKVGVVLLIKYRNTTRVKARAIGCLRLNSCLVSGQGEYGCALLRITLWEWACL